MRRTWYAMTALLAVGFLAAAAPRAQDMVRPREMLKTVTAEKYPGADAVVVLDKTHVDVEESGLSHVYRTQLVKVLTEAGAAKYATMRFDYDPASSYAEVRGLKIYRADGSVEQVPVSRILDLPQPQFMIYWGPRMKLASVPKLNPGDAVEIETYSKGFVIAYLHDPAQAGDEKYIPPMRGHYYDVVLFQGDLPIVKKVYTIVLPRDKPIRAEVFNGELGSEASFNDKSLTYTWWKTDVPAVEREPKMVEDTDCLPKLVLATVKDWPQKSRWFYHVNEDVDTFAWNDAIKAKVDEITKGLKTDDEKRKALLAWVARQIRYSGISMGKGEGYTLHPGVMDFNDRAGVCKDIAGMLITMFRAAGFTHTYPAMTMAGARVENLPADQFNHCVVATEIAPNTYKLYDPTWCPFSSEIWSSAEKPQNYVIGSPRGEQLMETPPAPASDNFIDLKAEDRIDEKGNLEGTLTITGGHYSETNLRWAVVFSPAYAVKGTFEQWLSKISPAGRALQLRDDGPGRCRQALQDHDQVQGPGIRHGVGRKDGLHPAHGEEHPVEPAPDGLHGRRARRQAPIRDLPEGDARVQLPRIHRPAEGVPARSRAEGRRCGRARRRVLGRAGLHAGAPLAQGATRHQEEDHPRVRVRRPQVGRRRVQRLRPRVRRREPVGGQDENRSHEPRWKAQIRHDPGAGLGRPRAVRRRRAGRTPRALRRDADGEGLPERRRPRALGAHGVHAHARRAHPEEGRQDRKDPHLPRHGRHRRSQGRLQQDRPGPQGRDVPDLHARRPRGGRQAEQLQRNDALPARKGTRLHGLAADGHDEGGPGRQRGDGNRLHPDRQEAVAPLPWRRRGPRRRRAGPRADRVRNRAGRHGSPLQAL